MRARLELLRSAIRDGKCIRSEYADLPRELCPHALGRKQGKWHLLSYQIGGGSRRGLGPPGSDQNWRCMDVNGLWRVELALDLGWVSPAPHGVGSTCIDEIDSAVVLIAPR